MKLLLDLGNTRLKWAIAAPHIDSVRGAVAWDADVVGELTQAWQGLPQPYRVVGSSVVDDAREATIQTLITQVFSREVTWVRTPAEACGVRNAYAEPERLGIDRFLAMVAAHAAGNATCVLAGIGTALTLDALTADGRHLGGLIAPGPLLMQQSLLGATVRVRTDRTGAIQAIADNTADAVTSGCWQAVAALIERFTRHIAAQHAGEAPRLLLDGGDAAMLLPLLDLPAELAADSVLRGLLVWSDAHPAPASL